MWILLFVGNMGKRWCRTCLVYRCILLGSNWTGYRLRLAMDRRLGCRLFDILRSNGWRYRCETGGRNARRYNATVSANLWIRWGSIVIVAYLFINRRNAYNLCIFSCGQRNNSVFNQQIPARLQKRKRRRSAGDTSIGDNVCGGFEKYTKGIGGRYLKR